MKIFHSLLLVLCCLFVFNLYITDTNASLRNTLLGKDAVEGSTEATGLKASATKAGLKVKGDDTKLSVRVGKMIKTFLSVVGTIAVLFAMYGGFIWITAAGNSEKVNTAKKIIINAMIGVFIVSTSYMLVSLAITLGA